jgi:hypothetical protein
MKAIFLGFCFLGACTSLDAYFFKLCEFSLSDPFFLHLLWFAGPDKTTVASHACPSLPPQTPSFYTHVRFEVLAAHWDASRRSRCRCSRDRFVHRSIQLI